MIIYSIPEKISVSEEPYIFIEAHTELHFALLVFCKTRQVYHCQPDISKLFINNEVLGD
jgi:hypothetical protein